MHHPETGSFQKIPPLPYGLSYLVTSKPGNVNIFFKRKRSGEDGRGGLTLAATMLRPMPLCFFSVTVTTSGSFRIGCGERGRTPLGKAGHAKQERALCNRYSCTDPNAGLLRTPSSPPLSLTLFLSRSLPLLHSLNLARSSSLSHILFLAHSSLKFKFL